MKRTLSLLVALLLVLGLLPQLVLPGKATDGSLANLRYDDHVDMTGKTVNPLPNGHQAPPIPAAPMML